jgi:hypothetical protein
MAPTGIEGIGASGRGELYAPLRLVICDRCWLLQFEPVPKFVPAMSPAGDQGTNRSDEVGAGSGYKRVMAGDLLTRNDAVTRLLKLRRLLAPGGVATFEQPNLLRAVLGAHLDIFQPTRPCYPSLLWSERALAQAGLQLFDAEEREADGMLRLFAEQSGVQPRSPTARLLRLLTAEQQARFDDGVGYARLRFDAQSLRESLLESLLETRRYGGLVAAYGSAATHGQLLAYWRLGPDLIAFLADPDAKVDGGLVSGTSIPILSAELIAATRPSHLLLLPWRQRDALAAELDYIREWGGRFLVPLPRVELFG